MEAHLPDCALCDADPAVPFQYRTLNGACERQEPLCAHCAVVLDGTACVVSLRPAEPAAVRASD